MSLNRSPSSPPANAPHPQPQVHLEIQILPQNQTQFLHSPVTQPRLQQTQQSTEINQPLFFHRPPYGQLDEARGWAYLAIGRSVTFIGNAVFVGTAVIHLARQNAGCEPDDAECTGRTQYYGIRPSSLLSLYNVIVGLASTAVLPILGAVVDHTPHRRVVGRFSAMLYCCSLFPMIFLSESTWFIVAILLIVSAFVGWIHSGMVFAYLPEMSEDRKVLERLNTSFTVVQYVSDVLFIVVVVGTSAALGRMDDSLITARIAQSINFALTTSIWGFSWWKLMGSRPAMAAVPVGSHLVTVGFSKLFRTFLRIWKHHRALAWFYLAISFSESATQALIVIGTTFSIEVLNFSSSKTGIMILLVLIFSSVGCYLSPLSLKFLSPPRSNQICLLLLGLATGGVAGFVGGADQTVLFYAFSMLWGACAGWKYTIERYQTCTIIPKGQYAELMGLYLFAGQMLSWLPPLVFAAINEAGVPIRVSMLSLLIFFFIAMFFLQCMGSYENAVIVAHEVEGMSLSGSNPALSPSSEPSCALEG